MGEDSAERELGLLTPDRLAEMLDVAVSTLANWRAKKEGPSWVRIGRQVRYRKAAVEDWLRKQER